MEIIEEKLAKLLGYELDRIDEFNWNFIDSNGNKVGTVKYNKILDIYSTYLDSDDYYIDESRDCETKMFDVNVKGKGSLDIRFSDTYPLIMLRTNNKESFIITCFDDVLDHPGLDREGLFISYGLFIDHSWEVGDTSMTEMIKFANQKYDKDHIHKLYQYDYIVNKGDSKRKNTIRAISYMDNPYELFISKKELTNKDQFAKVNCEISSQTVEEYTEEKGRATDVITRIRDVLTDMFPYDIFSDLFNEKIMFKYGFTSLCENYQRKRKK